MVLPVDKEPRDPETTYSALEQEACLGVLILVIQIQIQHDSHPYQAHNPVKEMCRQKNMKERTAKEKQCKRQKQQPSLSPGMLWKDPLPR